MSATPSNKYRSECEMCKDFALVVSSQALNGVWFHVPNGQKRNAKAGAVDKAMGAKAGVSDYCFLRPDCQLFLEFKTPDGAQSKLQKKFADQVAQNGMIYKIARSPLEALQILEAHGFLSLPIESDNPIVKRALCRIETVGSH